MFYAMQLSVSVSEGTGTRTFWSFERRADRDLCVECNPTFHAVSKPNKGVLVAVFKRFRETRSGLFLLPSEK